MPLAPGTRLGPFEIECPVGAGGMGEVYRARDTRLGREVAVKVLPAEVAADADRVHRFELEARAAAALNHPNILVLHDVGTHHGAPYLVTELLEGETLRSRLRRGRLTPDEASELGTQVARGLAAAHDKGIVHRDLKPENLFVTADETVKILDFGLARLTTTRTHEPTGETATASAATAAGTVLGTVGYMAPEQARGRPAGPHADVFALGCVLYEMLTGDRAFRGDTAADTLAAVLTREPPDLETQVESVPPGLTEVVRRCLRKDPEERFASGREVYEALRSGATPRPQARPGPAPPRLRVRRGVAVLGMVAVMVAAGMLWLRGRTAPEPTTAQPDPRRLAVAPFENLTGDPGLDRLGPMAAETVADGLAGLDGVEVAASALSEGPTATLDSLRAAASELRAGTLVTGSYSTGGETLKLTARLVDVPSGSIVYALDPVSGSRDDLQAALHSLRETVAGAVAYHFDRSLLSGASLRPVSYEAYREVAAAFGALGFDSEALLEHLERAVEIDPEFWMARLRLGMLYTALDRTDEAEAQFAEVRRNLSSLNTLELRALEFFDARRSGRRLEALQIARRIHEDEPRDRLFGLVAATTALAANRPREALALLGPLADFDWAEMGRWPQGSFFIRCSALAHHLLGEYEAELSDARLGLEHYPGLVRVREDQARALAALGRVDEVEATVEESLALPIRGFASAGTVMLEASEELRAHGHPAAAVRVAERAAEWYANRPAGDTEGALSGANRAEILWMAERYEEAREAAEDFARESPKNVHANGIRGVMAAKAGDLETADRFDRDLAAEQRPMRKGYASYWRACIAAQKGEVDRAVEHLREAFARGMPFDQYIHRFVYLETLHGYPPFEELIAPKG